MKNILVTGNLGFIGFNFCKMLKEKRPELRIFGLDCATYAAKFMIDEKKRWLKDNDVVQFYEDIRYNKGVINEYVKAYGIDTIVHFCAESHVDNSILGPSVFIETNVLGTANLLEVARENNLRIHIIGTDEVYGITYPESNVNEGSILCPSSPYSSSKASADLVAMSYFKTFGTKVTVSRCTNNMGMWQHPEKLIPTVITKALKNENIPVYGDGMQRRHWIDVDEHNEAVLNILEFGEIGEVYNIAPLPENYISNMDIITFILKKLALPETLITHVKDRAAHDTSYFLRDEKYQTMCRRSKAVSHKRRWQDTLDKTVDWYRKMIERCVK